MSSLATFMKHCGCEDFVKNFEADDIELNDVLEMQLEDLEDYIPDLEKRKKCFSHIEKTLKSQQSLESEDTKKLKAFLEKCKCGKFLNDFIEKGLSFTNIAELTENNAKKIIKKKFLLKKFLTRQRTVFNKCDISRKDVTKLVEKNVNQDIQKRLDLYILPRGSAEIGDKEEDMFDVIPKVDQFLKNEKHKVLLLLGDAGSGKSLFNQYLQTKKLKDKKSVRIPLFISLTAVQNPCKQLVLTHLSDHLGLGRKEGRYVMNNYPLLLILDGFDEVNEKYRRNLYRSNLFSSLVNVKIVISCRTSALFHVSGKRNFKELFSPVGENGYDFSALTQIVIRPFSNKNIEDYITKYVKKNKSDWDMKKYMEVIKDENLLQLLSNPFLLFVGLSSLSDIVKNKKEDVSITRYDMYDSFINKWFDREKAKLKNSKDKTIEQTEMKKFCQILALEMLKRKSGNVFYFTKEIFESNYLEENDISDDDEKEWVKFFLDVRKDYKSGNDVFNLLNSCPLCKVGEANYQFLHKSFWEFVISTCVMKDLKEDSMKKKIRTLNMMMLNSERSIVQFIGNVLKENEAVKSELLEVVLYSKKRTDVSIASANAATILNDSWYSFSGLDLSNIDISGADLTKSNFLGTNLKNSNLLNCNFKNSLLSHANFEGSDLTGCNFGTKSFPRMMHDEDVMDFKLSPCGNYIASYDCLCLCIYIWNFKTSKLLKTLEGHSNKGELSFSWHPNPSLVLLASCSENEDEYKNVIIWDGRNGFSPIKLKTTDVVQIAWHPKSRMIACRYMSKEERCNVKIWRGKDFGESELVTFPSEDVEFISCNSTNFVFVTRVTKHKINVNIWDSEKGESARKIEIHSGISDIKMKWSFNDLFFAVWGVSGLVVCDMKNNCEITMLEKGLIKGVSWNPDPSLLQLASYCGFDEVIKIWDGKNKWNCVKKIEESDTIGSISFHPSFCLLTATIEGSQIKIYDGMDDYNCCSEVDGEFEEVFFVPHDKMSELILLTKSNECVQVFKVINEKNTENKIFYRKIGMSFEEIMGDSQILLDHDTSLFVEREYGGDIDQTSIIIHHVSMKNGNIFKSQKLNLGDIRALGFGVSWHPEASKQLFASWRDDETIVSWEGNSIVLSGHSEEVSCVSWHPNRDKYILATGSRDKTVRIWEKKNEKFECTKVLKQSEKVDFLSFHPDLEQKLLVVTVSGGDFSYVCFWDWTKSKCLYSHELDFCVTDGGWHPDKSKKVFAFSEKEIIWIFDLQIGYERGLMEVPSCTEVPEEIYCIKWHPDPTLNVLFMMNESGNLFVLDGNNGYKCEQLFGFFPQPHHFSCFMQKKSLFIVSYMKNGTFFRIDKFEDSSNILTSKRKCVSMTNSFFNCEKSNFSKCRISSKSKSILGQQKGVIMDDLIMVNDENEFEKGVVGENKESMGQHSQFKSNVQKKLALVIGNSDYSDFSKLKNASNDSKEVSKVLKSLGFDVTHVTDLDSDDLLDEFDNFCAKVGDYEKQNPIAVLFFSGHGVYSRNTISEFLLPVDIEQKDFIVYCDSSNSDLKLVEKREKKLSVKCLSLNTIKTSLCTYLGGVNFLFLDACRSVLKVMVKSKKDQNVSKQKHEISKFEEKRNDLQKKYYSEVMNGQSGGQTKGIGGSSNNNTKTVASKGYVCMYSTSIKCVAFDGEGTNSLFTLALCECLKKKDSLQNLLSSVQSEVLEKSNRNQNPEISFSALGLLNLKWPDLK